jgi:endonuclease YncB( thermonuclease family)
MRFIPWIAFLSPWVLAASPLPEISLQKLERCTYVPTAWADGDSFQIKTAAGAEHSIRLYGVDCLELHLDVGTNLNRLLEQRRYFGIAEVASTPQESIEIAKGLARNASEKTASLLGKPFTVHTRFATATGAPGTKPVYGIVTCADGTDLAAKLVETGLARAWGLDSDYPDGKTLKEAEGMLQDLELLAAKHGIGIWAKTNWANIAAERQTQRRENAGHNVTNPDSTPSSGLQLDPNTAHRLEIVKLPGIKAPMADLIIKHRPYKNPDDLLKVPGMTAAKLNKIRSNLVFPES